MTSQPVLHNIRILDFSWVLAGPYATRILADFGAEVIKVQPLLPQEEDRFSRGYYNTWNRNKRGISLDLNKPEGVALVEKLVLISDVVVENFTPRVMANWGLDYPNLKKLKPDIIMLSLSTTGSTGPWRDYTGFGTTAHAFSGMTDLTSYPGKPPSGLGYSYADHVAGVAAVLGLLSAMEFRRKTDEGQFIDVSLLEAMTGLLGNAFLEYATTGKPPEPSGCHSHAAAPRGVYRCQGDDRWCTITVETDDEWQLFKRAMGNPAWAESARFATATERLKNAGELDRLVGEWTQQYTAAEVMALLQSHDLAAGVVQNARDLARDPQLNARGFFIELEHPELGRTISDATPIKLSATPARYEKTAPVMGQDNGYVYGELLGLSEDEMADLKKQGVI
jgi:crotonobetainyl-CoA:carnitine CoA-transferase CaiB-like acyl-CoA transferase